ncbi:esterase [Actinoplanes italicus]|uniref:Acetyl esterase/lipase n=1 Tax=Actinoplanes italicus TaxID=113567 RepID=A0A2T0JSB8_9ACTN|nr:alpha/beta hydrolase fold domain-containing protein [Actinoplanes italicus]PRX10531.1 acetyl esterase/lipase [Actinoplanes italicus]GIE36085.1 esterase [Actinoplanes italicus]
MSITIKNRRIDGPYGTIPIRVHTTDGDARAGLVWAHGGAFFGGDLDMPESDWVARQLAERSIAVVTVDYRLAPIMDWTTGEQAPAQPGERFHYPVASEELTAAFSWAAASDIRVPGWAIGGASAGGNLAAGATLRLRDNGLPLPSAVLLVYPVLHSELPPMSAELHAKVTTLPDPDLVGADAIHRMNLNYVRDPAGLGEPYAFPGGHDLTGLPPTMILNSDIDPLRASGQQYGAELAAAGVDVLMIREVGAHHGHLNEPDNPVAAHSISRMADWLLSGLGFI